MADFSIFYVVESLTRRMLEVASGPDAVAMLFGDKPAIAQHQEMMSTRPNGKLPELRHMAGLRTLLDRQRNTGGPNTRTGAGRDRTGSFETLASLLLQLSNT